MSNSYSSKIHIQADYNLQPKWVMFIYSNQCKQVKIISLKLHVGFLADNYRTAIGHQASSCCKKLILS